MNIDVAPELWLRTVLLRNKLQIGDHTLSLLKQYVEELLRANKVVNLISRKDEAHVWSHHIAHCLSILFLVRFPEKCRVLDLGSGGGLPGVPLKILLPTLKLTMLDATKKKISAVKTIVEALKLEDVEAVWGRAEELGTSESFKERYDVVLARAVGPLDELARLARPFLRKSPDNEEPAAASKGVLLLKDPCLVAYKGGDVSAELEKARRIRYVRSVKTKPLVFEGSEQMSLEDKKVVVVEFT